MPLRQAARAHDTVGASAHLAARQCVAKLMQSHDQEQGEIFQDIPGYRRMATLAALDLIDHRPGTTTNAEKASIPENRNRWIDPGGQ